MSKSELEKFYNSDEGKIAGLSTKEAKQLGIHSGRESARWILKMLDTPKEEWSPIMWAWANRQISFISRMSGMRGGLYKDNGEKTRKHLSLLIWGNNPKKKAMGGNIDTNYFKKGGEVNEKLFSRDAIFISKIIELEQKFVPNDERLIDVNTPNISAFRNSVADWVKNPKNNVRVIIAFSGGKDSVALVLHALFTLNIPKEQIELWHHEVDGFGDKVFDWQCTPSYCQAFADKFDLPLLFSYRKNGIIGEVQKNNSTSENIYFQSEPGGEYQEWKGKRGTKSEPEKYVNTRNKFPGTSADLDARWCSEKVKIELMARTITNDSRFEKGNFLIMTGERREESPNRSGYAEIEPYVNMTKNRTALTWRTIIDMTEKDIWGLMEKHKIQPHPCYMLGWGRCSCQLCIFNDADTFATIREVSPEKIQKISDLEKQNVERGSEQPYLKSYKPKKSEVFSPQTSIFEEKAEFEKGGNQGIPINKWIDKNKGQSFYNPKTDAIWLKQALGEFTSPIIVENWVLPKGAFSKKQNGAN
jgi:3'-phosphoadenosine 5'-phosphosulfate sulfotransferase (PAPS reductase)/FAD synthetase